MKVRFGICADLHVDFIHDGVWRFEQFLDECKKAEVDFCVQLGDFCPPNGNQMKDKECIIKKIEDYSIPFYHTLGNHDMDANNKQEVMEYIGMQNNYYSFDFGGVHFMVIDACYYEQSGLYIDYEKGNYKKVSEDARVPVLPPCELEWIKEDLQKTIYPTIVFSHQSLVESRAGIQNADVFRETINDAPKGVFAAICGHEHVDRIENKDGVWYMCVNSMSYYWAGSKYKHETYGKEIVEKHPRLESVFPYQEPLYAIVDVTDEAIYVNGVESKIIGATPEQLQFKKIGLTDKITASVIDRTIKTNRG